MSEEIDSDSHERITVDTTFQYRFLPDNVQRELVRKLNNCDCIKNHKQAVITRLLPTLQERIQEEPELLYWTNGLLIKCDDIGGGFQSLLNAVSFFDGDTISYRQLTLFYKQTILGEKSSTYKKNIINFPINEAPSVIMKIDRSPEIPPMEIQPISKRELRQLHEIFEKYTVAIDNHVKSERMQRTIAELSCLLDQIKELSETDQKNKIKTERMNYRGKAAKINGDLPSLKLGSNDTICQNGQLESILLSIKNFAKEESTRKLSTDDLEQQLDDMEEKWLEAKVNAQNMAIICGNVVNECRFDFTRLLSQIISS